MESQRSYIKAFWVLQQASNLCERVWVLMKYGHYEDAANEIRSADFIDPELKESLCRDLELNKKFDDCLLIHPLMRRCSIALKTSD